MNDECQRKNDTTRDLRRKRLLECILEDELSVAYKVVLLCFAALGRCWRFLDQHVPASDSQLLQLVGNKVRSDEVDHIELQSVPKMLGDTCFTWAT